MERMVDEPDLPKPCTHTTRSGSFLSHGETKPRFEKWERKDPDLVVWVHGFGRSGSSTILSMVRAYDESAPMMAELLQSHEKVNLDISMEDMRHQHHVFTMFEPCHTGDHPQVKDSDECTERL